MLISIIKIYARFAIKIFCRKIVINNSEWLHAKGPLLLAANHPNSFLDGIILTTLFEENIYSLARGDAFKMSLASKLLKTMHLLPVYRTSEGVENLEHNYTTFAACQEAFKKNKIVLIFSEGRCMNEWHLRPLKKGTARLAISTWELGIDLTVVPVGFNYNTFRNFGKNVFIHFGDPLNKEEIIQYDTEGKRLLYFNQQLKSQLKNLVYEIDPIDIEKQKELLYVHQSFTKKILLAIPALAGFILHAPLYFTVKGATKLFFDNDHFDSVVVSLLLILYPLYIIAAIIVCIQLFNPFIVIAAIILLPFTAWACVQLKNQL